MIKIRARYFLLIVALATLLLAACGDQSSSITQSQAGKMPKAAPYKGVQTTCNYGQAVEQAKQFLQEHRKDDKHLPSDWVRGVIVKTLYSEQDSDQSWLGTMVISGGRLQRLQAGENDSGDTDFDMAALVTVGDYIAFDNSDGDWSVEAPTPSNNKELVFLGHGVTPCT